MACLFCKIVAGEIPSKKVFEDELTYAFRDINPQAPTHILVVPRKHIGSLAETEAGDGEMLGYLHLVAARIAKSEGLKSGYRTVINTGPDGGQTVDHLHVHLLGGRGMSWPPG
ncbi:MAG TPA: histidine triad nucleotide-binding protein [Acidobacteriaceae bacterium]|nr:histidine triad nucleotide-binding protein [Acidobacteriaceae bacterium]